MHHTSSRHDELSPSVVGIEAVEVKVEDEVAAVVNVDVDRGVEVLITSSVGLNEVVVLSLQAPQRAGQSRKT